MKSKEQLQEDLYKFPYHYLTHIEDNSIYIYRYLFWGLEHLTYINYVIDDLVQTSPNSLLDCGCGEGRVLFEVNRRIQKSCMFHGLDISEAAIRFAKAFVPQVTFSVHDIVAEPFQKTFDYAVSCEVIEHIKPEEIDAYCKNIAKSLNTDGALYLTTPTTNIPTSRKHYQHFTYELLEEYLRPHFEITETIYLNKKNWLSRFLDRLLANKFFISNSPSLNRWVLRTYQKKLLVAEKNTGSRIFIKARKI